jgi:hypothetical protein
MRVRASLRAFSDTFSLRYEVEGHAQLARDLGMMTEPDFSSFLARVVDVRKMLHGLLKRVKATGNGHRAPGTGYRERELDYPIALDASVASSPFASPALIQITSWATT